ncbi:MAG: hypothetical protein PUP92_23170 [Rhizonema sp. PD38]|nr:hypothetical protein [Rhizonema sp. PD38]
MNEPLNQPNSLKTFTVGQKVPGVTSRKADALICLIDSFARKVVYLTYHNQMFLVFLLGAKVKFVK